MSTSSNVTNPANRFSSSTTGTRRNRPVRTPSTGDISSKFKVQRPIFEVPSFSAGVAGQQLFDSRQLSLLTWCSSLGALLNLQLLCGAIAP